MRLLSTSVAVPSAVPPTHACSRCGFTLIEMLVVIAIMGALMALLMPTAGMIMFKAEEVQCLNNMRQIATGSLAKAQDYRGKSWYDAECQKYPTSVHPGTGTAPRTTYTFPGGTLQVEYSMAGNGSWDPASGVSWYKFRAFGFAADLREMGIPYSAFRCPADPEDFGKSFDIQSWWASAAQRAIITSDQTFFNSYAISEYAFRISEASTNRVSFKLGNLGQRWMLYEELGERNLDSVHRRGTSTYAVGGANAVGLSAFLDGRAARWNWAQLPGQKVVAASGVNEYVPGWEVGYYGGNGEYLDDVKP
jgi:prepilin-type N-terminal cleavage/methylation domain-containing protein